MNRRDGVIQEFAPAKINLALHVTGRRSDGYHLLDSLAVFAKTGDRLQFACAHEFTLEVTGPFARDLGDLADNLVFRAARSWSGAAPGSNSPAAIKLEKNLPVASGIGGGSADAAACIRGLCRLWGLGGPGPMAMNVALELGADVPMCLTSQSCRVTGIGEAVTKVDHMPTMPAILVNPTVPVRTADVFSSLGLTSGIDASAPLEDVPNNGHFDDWISWIGRQRNDLETPALKIAPEIGETLNAINDCEGCGLARVSGSGATCFGLFETDDLASTAAVRISALRPDWWTIATTLG